MKDNKFKWSEDKVKEMTEKRIAIFKQEIIEVGFLSFPSLTYIRDSAPLLSIKRSGTKATALPFTENIATLILP